MKIPVEYFPVVEGSMTSPDGQVFMFKVRRENGKELMLGFPHSQIPTIVECAAMQADQGRDQDGERVVSAFKTSAMELARGPEGETVLCLMIGLTGKISFLLSADMQEELFEALGNLVTRH